MTPAPKNSKRTTAGAGASVRSQRPNKPPQRAEIKGAKSAPPAQGAAGHRSSHGLSIPLTSGNSDTRLVSDPERPGYRHLVVNGRQVPWGHVVTIKRSALIVYHGYLRRTNWMERQLVGSDAVVVETIPRDQDGFPQPALQRRLVRLTDRLDIQPQGAA